MDYRLNVCVSRETYDGKPTQADISSIRYECNELTIDEFVQKITSGHTFCALMKDNWRNKNNFKCTSMLVYDIDHSDIPMNDYVSTLEIKPTFAYTSPSNKEDDCRFRLIFCLDFKICTLDEYYTISKSFSEQLMLKYVDEHSYLGEQYWNGNSNAEVVQYNNVLSIDSINVNTVYKREFNSNNTKRTVKHNIEIHNILCENVQFIDDYWNLSFEELLLKYQYPNLMKTHIDYTDDEPIVYYPTNYIEITRPWQKINGNELKLKDGEGRRKKLYVNAILRRVINPSITFDNLLYNIVWEFYHYYINNGNRIDKKTLYDIVANAMKAEINTELITKGKPRYKFFVNKRYCEKYGVTIQQVMGKLRNKKQYIGELYDPSLTDKQNLEIMNQYGLDIKSVKTIQRWRQENNIKKYNKK